MAKIAYRVRNWSQYNQDLKRRGDITVWIDDAVANSWYCQGSKEKIGVPFIYSDAAITCSLTIGAVFFWLTSATNRRIFDKYPAVDGS